ncbi:MAG: SGNH/GDSL hydrolase family protein [Flavobacteriaceae bacterium]|jgi:lysophospholipase L1-like esterase|nr:SGNH/GDSL hydrolase family protein [Flavobacteriaceae bacterium]NVJ72724.1 SGNH/GDSL hydrolase family protein [Flavobacteriaceae bacterium]
MNFKYLLLILLMGSSLGLSAQDYLALGDSYTIGESVQESERWPNQLAEVLKGTSLEVETVTIIAKTGWTTAELINGIESKKNTNQYDLVSLLIGVNNQYRGQSLERFETELIQLIKTALKYSKNGAQGVFLVSIPDWGVTPFAKDRDVKKIALEIQAFNKVIQKQANEFKLPFIDITSISKEAKTDLSLLAPDELHPSGKMYNFWVQKIKKELLKTP